VANEQLDKLVEEMRDKSAMTQAGRVTLYPKMPYAISVDVRHGATVLVERIKYVTFEMAEDYCKRLFPGWQYPRDTKCLTDGKMLTEVFFPSEKSDVLTTVRVYKRKRS
jgi:hypothetical protein